ncbi:MAG TPA: PP2C family protein-serine/threonine phosphatase [Anaerolineales bacterium]|nr:PP2C family protein-serine/threonine phosphatase [Anaerolineales bacterium]
MSTNLLARIPFFTDLPEDELDRIMAQLEIVNLKSGEILFREGDPGENMYIVVSGDLEILMAPDTDNELILNRVPQGEYIGEMSLVTGAPRTASVRAHGDVVLLSMSRAQLLDLLHQHPQLASTMVSVLSHRLDNTNVSTFRDLTEKNRQLQQAFDELKAAQEQLIEKERLERELKVAAEIQMSILPDALPLVDGYDFGGRILPARQVGGDFYDVFILDTNKIGVLIGDVADKGVPSAIFMARAHALIIAEADSIISPGDVLRRVNRHITRLEKSTQFVTALYGVLDINTGEFVYARAGHEPPLMLTPNGEVHRLPHKPGMALGLWENITLDEYSVHLPKDSLLVMFTDGMTDCRNPKGQPFGLEKIKQTMAGLGPVTAQSGCDQLFDSLMLYQSGAKQDDDVTLVAIHALS